MWQKRWGYEIAAKPTSPGVWRLKTGGYLIAGRVGTTQRVWRQKVMHTATLAEAKRERHALLEDTRAQLQGRALERMRWSEFVSSLYERKVLNGDLKSPKTRERWDTTLRLHLIPAFGALWCHDLRYAHVVLWKDTVLAPRFHKPKLVEVVDPKTKKRRRVRNKEHLSPRTANGFLSILRVVTKAMAAELQLDRDPAIAVSDFDLSTSPTYTDEAPNSLSAEQARAFLAKMRELYPQHYPMVLLGFVTGLRPSTLRPLRRAGATPDVLWDESCILVRRSNSLGQEILDKSKTGKRQRVALPVDVMVVLKAHSARLSEDQELLFPSDEGGFLSRSALDKPFARVTKALGLPFAVTPRAMRRTFQDLAREAGVADIVTRSISGHSTETMQAHYSTVRPDEMRAGIGRITGLLGPSRSPKVAGKKAGTEDD